VLDSDGELGQFGHGQLPAEHRDKARYAERQQVQAERGASDGGSAGLPLLTGDMFGLSRRRPLAVLTRWGVVAASGPWPVGWPACWPA